MKIAIEQAHIAYNAGEVPVGACVVCDNEVISKSHNTREKEKNALRHAEITAIEEACKILNGWRLNKCTLYVTLEPCLMCAGAIINSRIKRVVFAAKDPNGGACGSIINIMQYPLAPMPKLESGLLADESLELLKSFFKLKR